MTLSRRSFLQLVGASVAATTLRPVHGLMAGANDNTYQGRALKAMPVFATPQMTNSPIARLWPDSITAIVDQQVDWYQISSGWVQRDGIQLMLPYNPQAYTFNHTAPFWAEVAAPAASIRAYCAADAPLVTRIGHGGVLRVIDALPGEPNGWYGVADAHGVLMGWTQGVFWRPIEFEDEAREAHTLHFNQRHYLMSAYDGDELVLEAPFSSVATLAKGKFQSRRGAMGGASISDYQGVPWQTVFGNGQTIAGAYWHNRFGQAVEGGTAIQLTPLLARWVYGWLGEDAHIVVE